MRLLALAAAAGVLSAAVEAAPRHRDRDQSEAEYPEAMARGAVKPRWLRNRGSSKANQTQSVPAGCPTGVVLVSTTTVDVTIYVTLTANATEPRAEESMTAAPPGGSSTEPCDDYTTTSGPAEEPCETSGPPSLVSTAAHLPTTSSGSSGVGTSTSTTEPCDEETTATTATPCDSTDVYPSSSTEEPPCDSPVPKDTSTTEPCESSAASITEPCDEATAPASTCSPAPFSPAPSRSG